MASSRKVLVERNVAEDVPYATVFRRYSLIGSVGESLQRILCQSTSSSGTLIWRNIFSTSAQMATLKIRHWIRIGKSSGCTLGPTKSRSLRDSPDEV
ncbi:hypothetical protein TNIN_238801 [Trichonephila inaurata madagascariensis]|uniref:Uncharacterized protein n=1 Tax=Trichonephila inaurata madagascariensis TaxID=2747483 RepID=A0A8X6WW52_9ARAC|nr:hypothetical protein TNIN_238801 [Trichonephila inaurata madagascariensis]